MPNKPLKNQFIWSSGPQAKGLNAERIQITENSKPVHKYDYNWHKKALKANSK